MKYFDYHWHLIHYLKVSTFHSLCRHAQLQVDITYYRSGGICPLLVHIFFARVSPSLPVISSMTTTSFHHVLWWSESWNPSDDDVHEVQSGTRCSISSITDRSCRPVFSSVWWCHHVHCLRRWFPAWRCHRWVAKPYIWRQYRRCAGVSGSGSSRFGETCVNERLFMMVSISITTICSVSRLR